MSAGLVRRSPSAKQLDELAETLKRFLWDDERSFNSSALIQERNRLPGFVRVVDAMQALRGLKEIQGWPVWLADLVAAIIKTFDVLAYSWGWGELLKSEECRADYIKKCECKFRESYLLPIHEAAKACREKLSVIDSPPFLEDLCESVPPIEFDLMSFTSDQGPLRPLFEAVYRKRRALLFGESYPILSDLGGDSGDFKSDQVLGDTLKRAHQKLAHLLAKVKDSAVEPSLMITNPDDAPSPCGFGTQHADDPERPTSRNDPEASNAVPSSERAGRIAASVAEDQTMQRDKVIVSYSHKDKKFLGELLAHLKPLQRAGRVVSWSDQDIKPGSQWFNEIQSAVGSARVAVLLVTKDFLASDFIHDHELGPLLKEAETGGVTILWVLVRDCNWKATPLQRLQAAYPTDRPLAQMKAERDTAWVTICAAIQAAAN